MKYLSTASRHTRYHCRPPVEKKRYLWTSQNVSHRNRRTDIDLKDSNSCIPIHFTVPYYSHFTSCIIRVRVGLEYIHTRIFVHVLVRRYSVLVRIQLQVDNFCCPNYTQSMTYIAFDRMRYYEIRNIRITMSRMKKIPRNIYKTTKF